MTPREALAHLSSLPPSSIKMGLERVLAALARLGEPQRAVPALHVAGTNGKGSTCALAASCLATRYRTGLYTSPHLVRVNERIQVGGAPIDDETLGQRTAEVIERLGVDHELTFFELGTVVAFWHFAQERVDVAVLETGLGGRLDATTACAPRVTCLTPIDLDHQQYLGTTLAAIAAEKAGILKPGVPVVSSRQPPQALEVIARAAGEQLCLEGRDFEGTRSSFRGRAWRLDGLALPLRGPHQAQNLAVALASLEALAERGFPLTADEVHAGVAATRWPGRFEVVPGTAPPVVLDGAHNPAGVATLLAALDAEFPGRPVHLVFGVLQDKDGDRMLEALLPHVASVALTAVDSPRARPVASLEPLARSRGAQVTTHAAPFAALAFARAHCPKEGLVIVAGSLVLVGQVRAALVR